MKSVAILLLSLACVCYGQNATSPSGAALTKLVNDSFHNLDTSNDDLIERYEFNSFVIIADADNDGCMTLKEYKTFSAGTPDVATKIYHYFDKDNTNCITVDKVAGQFDLMDADHNKKVSLTEFETYYKNITREAETRV